MSSRGNIRSSASTLAAILTVTTALTPFAVEAQQVGPVGPGAPVAQPVQAQQTTQPEAQSAPVSGLPSSPAQMSVVRAIAIEGNQRLEPETVRSYMNLSVGDSYDQDVLDQALKQLFSTEFFADVQIRDNNGIITVVVRENPIINRIVFEGNKSLKDDKLRPEVKLAPRQIFTRSKVRADVARILELARRSGRFAASVNPKAIQLPQNRIDLVFEINEGPKSKVRQINVVGNEKFSDGELRGELATRQSRWWRFLTSNDTYDPDRTAYDREKLRQFYLTEGYADFRVASVGSELAPNRRDFIQTYLVEEGPRYKFGKIDVESRIRDLQPEMLRAIINIKEGSWYNAKQIENTIETLTETAGLFGYAFAEIRPQINRNKEDLTMDVTFVVNEAPRVYVERIDVNGNVRTLDKVVRREFRLAEGDPFNSFKVRRSRDRIQSLGFFQEKLEIDQKPGSTPDRVVLEVNVEEKSTGELQIGAGFSSLERFIADVSVTERNLMGKGQEARVSFTLSSYRNELELSFTEPYFMDKNLAAGIDLYRRDLNSFRYNSVGSNDRQTTYEEVTTGFRLRSGFPITEFWSLGLRYGLSQAEVSLDRGVYFTNGQCNLFTAGTYLCDLVGPAGKSNRTTSALGYTLVFDNRDNGIRPSRGQRFTFSQDVAGVGGGVNYVNSRVDYDRYFNLFNSGWILRSGIEGGWVFGWGGEDVRINDRFFLGGPRIRGFAIRGIGPRSIRTCTAAGVEAKTCMSDGLSYDDPLGGEMYYLGSMEIEMPLGAGAREMGLRTSAYVDVGSLWKVGRNPSFGTTTGVEERLLGDSAKPRVSVGVGVMWNSPFGPFRIDLAKALVKEEGDDTEVFQFNIGTQF